VVGDVDLDEFSTGVSKDQESEEQVEGEGRDDEEVDGDNLADMCRRKVRHVEDRRSEGRRMYLATVSSATS
jgi:hypothetical protein